MIFQWARNFQLIALVGYKSSLNNLLFSNSFHLLSWRTREIPKHLWEVKGLRSPTQYLWLVPFPSSGTSSQMLEQSWNELLNQSRMGYLPSSSCGLPKQVLLLGCVQKWRLKPENEQHHLPQCCATSHRLEKSTLAAVVRASGCLFRKVEFWSRCFSRT